MSEQYGNQSLPTALSADVAFDAVNLTVLDDTGLPATGPFRIIVGTDIANEIVIIGDRVGDSLHSLTRGAEGTTPADWPAGTPVSHVLTAGSFEQGITDSMDAHEADSGAHPQYVLGADVGVSGGIATLDGSGKVPDSQIPAAITRDTEYQAADAAHVAAGDPHPTYQTAAESQAQVDTGVATAEGYADTKDAAHVAAGDPHTGYQKESEKAAASGYASLDGSTKVPIAQLPTGTSGSTVALGNASVTAAQMPALTGDVTSSAGSTATTVAASLTRDIEVIKVFNVLDPQFAGGADPTGTTDSSAAFQAAIYAARALGSTISSTRSESLGIVYAPNGSYRWNTPVRIQNVQGFVFVGAGMGNTKILAGANSMACVLDVDGVQNGYIADFSIYGVGGQAGTSSSADKGVWVRSTSATNAMATAQVQVHRVQVADIRVKEAFRTGDDTFPANQVDPVDFIDCNALSPGDTSQYGTYWQRAFRLGNGTYGNNLDNYIRGGFTSGFKYGVELGCGSIGVFGHNFAGGSDANFYQTVHDETALIQEIRSESATRFFDTAGHTGSSDAVTLANVQFHGNNLHADGKFIKSHAGGSMALRNFKVTGNGAVAPVIEYGTSVASTPSTLLVDGLALVSATATTFLSLDAQSRAIVRALTILNTNLTTASHTTGPLTFLGTGANAMQPPLYKASATAIADADFPLAPSNGQTGSWRDTTNNRSYAAHRLNGAWAFVEVS